MFNMNQKNSRQTFLGENLEKVLENSRIGILGLGGGGSIICAELAHIGFKKFLLCDPDEFEESNINRLIGSMFTDIANSTEKIVIATRQIKGINPEAEIRVFKKRWQECIDEPSLKECKIIFSCLDDFMNRVQIEAFCRANNIILIDIGMTVKQDTVENFSIMGQIVLSHPEGPCFKCYRFIDEEDLKKEADQYGDAGNRPQVIWPNAILASTAIGLGVEILTNWNNRSTKVFYKRFDGNSLLLTDDLRVKEGITTEKKKCPHY